MTDSSPSIFLSYCHRDASCAEQIEEDLDVLGMSIVRDARSLKFMEDIPSYMKRIRNTDYALLLISDSFLRSGPCMNEVLELLKAEDHLERILPVIIPDYEVDQEPRIGAKIYRAEDVVGYIKFWEQRLDDVRSSAAGVKLEYLPEVATELKLTQQIATIVGEFIALVRRLKHVMFPDLIASGYKDLIERLGMPAITLNDIRRAKSIYSQAMAEKTLDKRLRYLNRALELFPRYPEALNKRGQLKDELGNYNDAIKDYDKAIEVAPFRAAAYISRSYARIRLKQLDDALADLDLAISIQPNHKEAFNNRADVLRRLGRLDDAKIDVERAIAIDSEFDLAYATMAEIAATEGDVEGFYQHLTRAVEYGYPLHKYSFDDIYEQFRTNDRFAALMEKSEHTNDRFI